MTSILVFAGSARRGAFSKQLAAAATTAITEWGAKPTLIDLADHDAPIYNGDLEDALGIPELCWSSAALSHRIMVSLSQHLNITAS